jgi:transketolase
MALLADVGRGVPSGYGGGGEELRAAFTTTLIEIAEGDDRVLLLTGDLGYKVLEPFAERCPKRFFNVGVAEQNMIGLATGLAECGFFTFAYSIATFATMRAYEFIRNGPVLQRLPVRVVGVGGGFEYGTAGPSHHALEDIGIMRLQPGLTVLAPADPAQAASVLRATWNHAGPIYYRIGKNDGDVVPDLDGRFTLGRTEIVRAGTDLIILTMGSVTPQVVFASDDLRRSGISTAVAIVSTLNPASKDDLSRHLQSFGTALTVEPHYATGGLGSLVAEVIADRGIGCRLHRLGVHEPADGHTGSDDYYLRRHGLSRDAIVKSAKRALASESASR